MFGACVEHVTERPWRVENPRRYWGIQVGVPGKGFEPSRPCGHQILNLACLPFHQPGVRPQPSPSRSSSRTDCTAGVLLRPEPQAHSGAIGRRIGEDRPGCLR